MALVWTPEPIDVMNADNLIILDPGLAAFPAGAVIGEE
jgi:hypothetical protein